jgi:carbon monoxide dehydrogenase subunit G
MTTSINKVFQVDHPIGEVWSNLTDPEKIVTCVPGASLTEKIDEDHYKGQVQLKVGPVKASYDGLITFVQRDAAARKMTLKGAGVDTKGKGSADITVNGQLTEKDGGTEVNVTMDINVTGMLAQFGSRLVGDVSNQLFDQFVANFKSKLSGGKVDNALHAGSMVGSMIKGVFGGKHE